MQADTRPQLKRILTVEDDAALRMNLAGYLEDCGYEVIEAADGRDGLKAFEHEQPDLVLVDLHMPGMDGVALLDELSKRDDSTPLIVVSGASDINEAIAATQSGAWDFVLKPLKDMKTLEAVMDRAWERACLLMENQRYQNHLEDEVSRRTDQLKQTNAELEASRELLANAERIARLGSWSWERTKDRVRFSEELLDILGLPADAERMELIFSRLAPKDRKTFEQALDNLSSPGAQFKMEHPVGSPGRERVLLHQAEAAGDPPGSRLDGVVLDITERRAMEDQLRSAKEAAEAANQAKSNFLATMSHELRTPLNGVIGMAQLIQNESAEEEVRNWAEVILSSGGALLRIIDEILDLAKIERGQLDLIDQPFELRAFLNNLTALFEATAQTKGLQLELDFAEDLPAWVVGDADRLNQILTNLLGNAFKFTAKGHVRLRCWVMQADSQGAQLGFAVEDTGLGVPQDLQEVIFEPFIQAEMTSTRRFGGLGLGLSIVRHLVERLGGTLKLDSQVDQGSRFELSLPFALVEAAGLKSKEPSGEIQPQQRALNILVAEDDPVNQDVIAALLQHLGCQTTLAEDGQAALEYFRSGRFDLIFLDLLMPLKDGYQTAQDIRAFETQHNLRPTPVYALSAKTGAGEEERCIQAGMDGHLAKPILLKRLGEVLHQTRINRTERIDEA